MGSILITEGRIWDGERFFFGDVLVKDDRIVQISENNERINEQADFVYSAKGKIVSAGLVDSHVHMRGISSKQFGIQAEMSTFPFGVTAAADASGVYGDRALLDSFALKNVIYVCADFEENQARFDNAEKMLQLYGDKAIGVKVYFDTGISQVKDSSALKQVCEYAHNKGLIVMVHCTNSPVKMAEILDCLGEGDILTHAFHGGIHNAAEDDYASMRLAKEKGVLIDAGMAGFIHTDFRIFADAIAKGVLPDIISTDITKSSAYKRGGRYGLTMCMSIAKYLGMKEEDIFRAVTVSPAKALGKDNEWGSLKVGRCADLTVLEESDEAFSMTDKAGCIIKSKIGYRCKLTISDGEVVFRD